MSAISQDIIRGITRKVVLPILVGDWLSLALWSLLILWTHKWYVRYWKTDHWLIRVAVGAALLNETVGMGASLSEVYLLTVTHWDDLNFLISLRWQSSTDSLFLGIASAILQTFLIVRYFRISKNKWICGFLTLGMFANFATCLRLTIELLRTPNHPDRLLTFVPPLVQAWVACSSVIDILIACALTFSIIRLRKMIVGASTKVSLKYLMIISFESGIISSVLQLVALIFYLVSPHTPLTKAAALPLRTTLPLVLLYNLLARSSLKKRTQQRSTEMKSTNLTPRPTSFPPSVGINVGVVSQVMIQMDIDDRAVDLDTVGKYYRTGRRSVEESKRQSGSSGVPSKCSQVGPLNPDFFKIFEATS